MNIGEFISPREVAVVFWGALFFIWTLGQPRMRRRYAGLVRAGMQLKVAAPLVAFALYIGVVVWSLYQVGMWDWIFLKDVAVWFVVTGFGLFVMTGTETSPSEVWRDALRSQFAAIMLLAFLVNTYTFSLWIELVLVPLLAVVVITRVVAEMKREHEDVAVLTGGVEAVLGLAVLLTAVVKAFQDYQALASLDSLQRLALPMVLTISAMPALYLVVIYGTLDRVWVWSRYRKSSSLKWYMRWRLFRYVGLSLARATEMRRMPPYKLMQVRSRADVNELVEQASQQQMAS